MRKRLAPISAVLLIASIFLPFYKTYGQLYPKGWVSLSEIVIPYLLFIPTIGFENAIAYGAQLMYTAVLILLVVGGLLVMVRGRLGSLLGLAAMSIVTLGSYAYLYSGDYALWSIAWLPSLMMGYYVGWLGAIVGLFAMPFKIRRKSSEKEAAAQTATAQGAKPSPTAAPTPPPIPSGVVVSPTITVTQTQTVLRMPPRPEEYAKPLPKPRPPRPEEEGSWLKQAGEGKPVEIPQPKTREGVGRIVEPERKRAEEAKPTEAPKQGPLEGAEDAKPKPSEGTETVEAARPGPAEEAKPAEVGSKPGPGETTPDDIVLAIDALKRRQESGAISMEVLRAELGKLMFTDPSDKYWTIDFRTGKWVYHDGERWVDGTPPPTLKTETSS
jgi:hypothetical protein